MKLLVRPGNVFVIGMIFGLGLHLAGLPLFLIGVLALIVGGMLNHEEVKAREQQQLNEEWQAEIRERQKERGDWLGP